MVTQKRVRLAGTYRRFGGKRFKLFLMPFPTKSSANHIAKTQRAKGNLARVVKCANGWSVYYRKKR